MKTAAVGDQVTVHVATINGRPQLVAGSITRIGRSGVRFEVQCVDGVARKVHAVNIAELAQDTWLNRFIARGIA